MIILANVFAIVCLLVVLGVMGWFVWGLLMWADFEDHKYDRKK